MRAAKTLYVTDFIFSFTPAVRPKCALYSLRKQVGYKIFRTTFSHDSVNSLGLNRPTAVHYRTAMIISISTLTNDTCVPRFCSAVIC